MSRSADSQTIEMVLADEVVARLMLEQCELLFGSDKGLILQPLQMKVRLFEPVSPEAVYVDQSDPIEDVLQVIFEQLYRVPADVKPSRSEIRAGLSDRQALIVMRYPTVELDQLQQILPRSSFVIEPFTAIATLQVLDTDLDCLETESMIESRTIILSAVQEYVAQKRWSEVLRIVRSTEQSFALAKLWGTWERLLNWGLQAAWALEDEVSEAWFLHQLGTLAFCQEQVTSAYDTLREALDLRVELNESAAVVVSRHNLSKLKTLIVPIETQHLPQNNQRHWFGAMGMIGLAFAWLAQF